MRTGNSEKITVPVPRRGTGVLFLAGAILLMLSVIAVLTASSDEEQMLLKAAEAKESTVPCYISIDGEKVALVSSEEEAHEVIENVVCEYSGNGKEFVYVEIEEEISLEKVNSENRSNSLPLLSVEEAEKEILAGDEGESYITVVTVEEDAVYESIEFEEEYEPDENLYIGQQEIETQGEEGCIEITREIVRENGEQVEDEVVNEKVIKEPKQQVVRTGTKSILEMPIDDVCISSEYGQRWGRMHEGTDFAAQQGSSIYAAESGTVYYAGYCGDYGKLVRIDHGNGMQTYYAHCSELLVCEGQKVTRGEKIALVGSTGRSTGPHLHFEVIVNGSCVDPVTVLNLE